MGEVLRDVYVRNCLAHGKIPGLLHPLPVFDSAFQKASVVSKSMPFDNMDSMTICVPCHKSIIAAQIATLWSDHIRRHYGSSEEVVLDRGLPALFGIFGRILQNPGIREKAVHIKISSNRWPNVETSVKYYLWPLIGHFQDDWSEFAKSTGFGTFDYRNGFQVLLNYI